MNHCKRNPNWFPFIANIYSRIHSFLICILPYPNRLYMVKMLLRLILLSIFFLVLSYLWQQVSSWGTITPSEYIVSDNITFLHLQSEVEKETSNQAINPYLTSGIKS